MKRDDQRGQVCFGQILNLVDQQQPSLASPRRSGTDQIEQVRQIELQVAAVGQPGFRLFRPFDADPYVTDLDFQRTDKAAQTA